MPGGIRTVGGIAAQLRLCPAGEAPGVVSGVVTGFEPRHCPTNRRCLSPGVFGPGRPRSLMRSRPCRRLCGPSRAVAPAPDRGTQVPTG